MHRSTQLSTLRGTAERLSAHRLSNNINGDGGCGWQQPVFGGLKLTAQVHHVATRRSVCIHQMNRVNSRNDSGHDDP